MIGNAVFGIKGHLNELSYATQQAGLVKKETADNAASTRDASEIQLRPEMLAEVPQMLESITRGIYRLEEILGEFRDFVLATQLHATPQDINQIMRTVTAESFPRNSNIDLALNLAPMLPQLHVDEVKLKRAFSELIENAIDFQPNGGKITIRTSLADAETVRELAGRDIALPVIKAEFIDGGPGLSESERQRVFQPFYTRKAKGMGLGLSIVKGIIEAHGGIIREIGAGQEGATHQSLTAGRARGNTGAHFVVLLPAPREEANAPVDEH
jgi:signal transduction histidine kinase